MQEPEIVSRKRIFDDFFALDEIKLKNENGGGDLTRFIVVPKKAVAVILYRPENKKIIFSKQYRLAAEKWLLEIPAGVMDGKNEDPDETVCRESLEETGYKIENPKLITCFFPSPGNSAEKIFLYFAEVKASDKVSKGGGLEAENEDIKVIEMDISEAFEKASNGEITDGKTLLGLLWLQNYLK